LEEETTVRFPDKFLFIIDGLTRREHHYFRLGGYYIRQYGPSNPILRATAYLLVALCYWNEYPGFPKAREGNHVEHPGRHWYPDLREEKEYENFYTIQDNFVFAVRIYISQVLTLPTFLRM
jgi:hypothetical protein